MKPKWTSCTRRKKKHVKSLWPFLTSRGNALTLVPRSLHTGRAVGRSKDYGGRGESFKGEGFASISAKISNFEPMFANENWIEYSVSNPLSPERFFAISQQRHSSWPERLSNWVVHAHNRLCIKCLAGAQVIPIILSSLITPVVDMIETYFMLSWKAVHSILDYV